MDGVPTRDNTRFAPGVCAGLTAEQVSTPEAEMGVRIRRRHLSVCPADGDRRAALRRQRRRRRARPARRHRLPAVDVPGHRPDPLGDRRRAARADSHVLLFGDLTGWFYALDAATGTTGLEECGPKSTKPFV